MPEQPSAPTSPTFAALLEEMAQIVGAMIVQVVKAIEPYMPALERGVRFYQVGLELKAAGWLPHDLIPFDLIEGLSDSSQIDDVLQRYFVENWSDVEPLLIARYEKAGLDQEALAAMTEALSAHRHGLYRCVCRTIFPEIDRMARQRYYNPQKLRARAGLEELREEFAELSLHDFGNDFLWFIHAFEAIDRTCYARVTENIESSTQQGRHLNRHAVIHGFATFSTVRDSINALFIADFMFHGIFALSTSRKGMDQMSREWALPSPGVVISQ